MKLVAPAIGSTSRCVQHSLPSSGGRRQRHERNRSTAGGSAGPTSVSAGETGVNASGASSAGSSLKLDAN